MYMYYIDDGHNFASRETQMRTVGLGTPGNMGYGYGVLLLSGRYNIMVSTNLRIISMVVQLVSVVSCSTYTLSYQCLGPYKAFIMF